MKDLPPTIRGTSEEWADLAAARPSKLCPKCHSLTVVTYETSRLGRAIFRRCTACGEREYLDVGQPSGAF